VEDAAMDRREPSPPLGSSPVAGAAPSGQDDELTYDSGGLSFGLMGVAMICGVLGCGGLILGVRILTLVAVVAALGVVGCAWVYYQMGVAYPRRRAERLRHAAAELGLTYQADAPPEQVEQLRRMPPFSAGRSHRACNLLVGTCQGAPVRLLDFFYKIGSGGKLYGRWQTVVLFPKAPGTPDFQLAPRNLVHRAAALLGAQDIRLSGAVGERFSHYYRLQGTPDAAVRAALDKRVVEYLAAHPGWTLSCGGGALAVWRTEPTQAEAGANFKLTSTVDPGFRYVTPAAIPKLLARAVAIGRLFAASGAG
jgi:hypothetical protein